jgi:hypothetical protein
VIKICVELWPFGYEGNKKVIGEGVIYNNGTGTPELGSYNASFATFGRDSNSYQAHMTNFPRQMDVWNLILLALQKMEQTEDIDKRVKHAIHSLRDQSGRARTQKRTERPSKR